jgi:hypothetical protein
LDTSLSEQRLKIKCLCPFREEYRGNRGSAPLILNLGDRWEGMVNMTPRLPYALGKAVVLIEAGLAPEPVWTFLEKRKICCSLFQPRTVQPVAE